MGMSKIEQLGGAYISSIKPILKKKALFSDTTENFVSPMQPTAYDLVTIRFRTGKNMWKS